MLTNNRIKKYQEIPTSLKKNNVSLIPRYEGTSAIEYGKIGLTIRKTRIQILWSGIVNPFFDSGSVLHLQNWHDTEKNDRSEHNSHCICVPQIQPLSFVFRSHKQRGRSNISRRVTVIAGVGQFGGGGAAVAPGGGTAAGMGGGE